MITPILALIAANAGCTALLGVPPRFYSHGEAPQGVAYPYATWTLISGTPESLLSETPPCDSHRVQVDVWANTGESSDEVAQAIRDCLEARGSLISFRTDRDPATKKFRVSADYLLWFNR